jgi:P pilus assembly chaperone PapD
VSRSAPLFAALALAGAVPAAAQGVMIAPTHIFIDHRTRSGSVLLYNPSTEPAEVTISVIFGYPASDSAGNIYLRSVEEPDSTLPSAAAWVQAFPRRLTVMPLERQTVRLLARPPAGLPDGEYWARLVVAAKGGQVPVSGVPDTADIQVGLTLEVRSLLGLYYRKGSPTTGVELSDASASLESDTLEFRARLTRQGNAAFIGTIRGRLVDSLGTTVAQFAMPTVVHYTLTSRVRTHVGVLPSGPYRLRVTIEPGREDIDSRSTLTAGVVVDSVEVRVP